jgi:hypothetical protein
MEDMKFGICRVNDPVNSSTFGIVDRKDDVWDWGWGLKNSNSL